MKYINISFLFILLVSVKSYATSFNYPIDGYSLDKSLQSRLNKTDLSAKDKVFIKQGHFYTRGVDEKPDTDDDVRIKFWGINLAPPLTFPETTEHARRLVKSISNLGFNLVRILGLDKFPVKDQFQTLLDIDSENPLENFHDENLAGLEMLLSALSEEGIYYSMVLKSGYTYDASRNCRNQNGRDICVPDASKAVIGFDGPLKPNTNSKHVDIFNREIREHLKLYTERIVSVIKHYPNIAMFELNNENSLIELFRKPANYLPPVYASELKQKWNNWLSDRYGSYDKMLDAWSKKTTDLSANKYSYTANEANGWIINEHELDGGLKRYKFKRRNVKLTAGEAYSVKVTTNKNDPTSVKVNLLGDHKKINTGKVTNRENNNNSSSIDLCLRSTGTVTHGIIDMTVLSKTRPVSVTFSHAQVLDPISLITANFTALDLIRDVDVVRLKTDGSCFFSNKVYEDYLTFLYDQEDQYYSEVVKYVKSLIDVPVNTTQAKYGGLLGQEIQIKHSDFMTSHFYWDHPSIPPNDQSSWTMTNDSFVENLDKFIGKMFSYSLIDGMPTVVSEFNVNHANQYSTGGYLVAAAYANFQDVDSLVLFTYYRSGGDTRNNIKDNRLTHWYNIIGDSRFSSLSLTASNLFRRSENKVAKDEQYISVEERLKPIYWGYSIRDIKKLLQNPVVTGNEETFKLSMPLTNKFRLTSGQNNLETDPDSKRKNSITDDLIWSSDKSKVVIDTPQTQAVIGKIDSTIGMSDVTVHTHQVYTHGVVVVSSLSQDSIKRSKELLITVVSEGKNNNTDLLKVNKRYRLCVKSGSRCVDNFWSKSAGDFKVGSMKLNVRINSNMERARLQVLNSDGISTDSKVIEAVKGVLNIELDGNKDAALWYKLIEL